MLNCGGELKADENWMIARTSWVHGVARCQKHNIGRSVCTALKVKEARSNRRPIRKSIEYNYRCHRLTFNTLPLVKSTAERELCSPRFEVQIETL